MSAFSFLKITLPSLFKKKETYLYPIQKRDPNPGLKGQIEMEENDCILCGKCSKACPSDAIVVDKTARTWTIDHYKCVTCRSCIIACPKACLSMSPYAADVVRCKHTHTFNIPERVKKPIKMAETSESSAVTPEA